MPRRVPSEREAKAEAWREQAEESFEEGRLEEAVLRYTKALYLSSEDPNLYAARGDVYVQLGDFRSAVANYRKALSLYPHVLACVRLACSRRSS